ncbi:GatB/YqeY domain-containing protein [Taklimakanibacter albus]|uniref:GatB/YqeY domain-containing protein n=1 Tax=Taklimakanibacter albus TaxID=2800327 RepID=A0ACC5R2U4_9HYPH|nr:GatB/YqeY domain-containing protein [Aestuariivirga sp. YIM B02566]MBK1866781.1 GatB/YqeY domain-containing protein [Aestuariivirga sp. YIM B02566]
MDMDKREDAAEAMKTRLRADLRAAMKDRRSGEADVLRSLVSAIDNAEAPPTQKEEIMSSLHRFRSGSAEVERLLLDGAQVRQVLLAEIQERELAAAEFDRLEKTVRAAALRAEVAIVRRYLA